MSADVVDVEYDCGCLTGRNVMTGRAFVTHCAAHRTAGPPQPVAPSEPQELALGIPGAVTPPGQPTFDALLRDPVEQFDKHSEVLKSIEEYRKATPCAASSPYVAHEMYDCAYPAGCWYEPHRRASAALAAPSEPQETTP